MFCHVSRDRQPSFTPSQWALYDVAQNDSDLGEDAVPAWMNVGHHLGLRKPKDFNWSRILFSRKDILCFILLSYSWPL